MSFLDIVGIVETVANSVAICEIVLMEMIVADRRSARTPILARNSVSALSPPSRKSLHIRAPSVSALFAEMGGETPIVELPNQYWRLSGIDTMGLPHHVSSVLHKKSRFAWPRTAPVARR
jgi:hypothetical protein